MQPLTMEDGGKKSGFYEYGKTVVIILAFIVSIVVAALALHKANDAQTQIIELQNQIVQILSGQTEMQAQGELCSAVQSCNQSNNDQSRENNEQLENLQRQVSGIQNQTNILQQAVENLEDNQANESVSNLSTTCSCNETNEVIMNLNETVFVLNPVNEFPVSQNVSSYSGLSPFIQLPWPHNGKIYSLTATAGSWSGARRECQSYGGDLAVTGIRDYVTRLTIASAMNLDETWVGLQDPQQNGNWTWVDGTMATDSEITWAVNQPDNFDFSEYCGVIWPRFNDYRMNDEQCNEMNHFGICEKNYEG